MEIKYGISKKVVVRVASYGLQATAEVQPMVYGHPCDTYRKILPSDPEKQAEILDDLVREGEARIQREQQYLTTVTKLAEEKGYKVTFEAAEEERDC